MKKLFLILVLSLMLTNAYALDARIYGDYELNGTWIINHTFGDDGENIPSQDGTFFEQYLEIWAEVSITESTRLFMSTMPLDRRMGGDVDFGTELYEGNIALDYAFIEYDLNDSLTLSGGRLPNDYMPYGWAQGFYNAKYEEYWAGDGFRADFAAADGINLWFQYQKDIEASTGDAGSIGGDNNGRDADTYMLGGDLILGDLYFNPRLSFHHDASDKSVEDSIALYGIYLDGAYLPDTGLNIVAAAAYLGGDSAGLVSIDDSYSAWGAYLDVAYVADRFALGALVAYSSYDTEKGYFTFGGDFDRTAFIDDEVLSAYGVPAMTIAQIYSELSFMDGRLLIMPSFSYYFSNVDDGYVVPLVDGEAYSFDIGADTSMMEFDLLAEYALTDSTTLALGYSFVQMCDITNTDFVEYNSDPAHRLFWTLTTSF